MKEIKNYIKDVKKLKDSLDKQNEKIKDVIYNILYECLNDVYEEYEEMKTNFILWENLENDEFIFNYPFGNIDFSELIKINERFIKEGFEISSIISNDIYKNKKGLDIGFKKC